MILSILGVLLCIIAGVAKAVQDTVAHHFEGSIFNDRDKFNAKFWDARKSWLNKWDYSSGVRKERFLGSSTIFVAFTDAWHAAQLFHINTLIIGIFIIGTTQDYYAVCV